MSKTETGQGTVKPATKRGAGRAEIMRAAAALFVERGVAGTSTSAIAAAAGVTQPLIYHHFKSKTGLWQAVFEDVHARLVAHLLDVLVQSADRPEMERLKAALVGYARFAGRNPVLCTVFSSVGIPFSDAFMAMYDTQFEPLLQRIGVDIAAAQAAGALRMDLSSGEMVLMSIGMVTQVFLGSRVAQRTFGLDVRDEAFIDRFAQTAADVVLSGMRPAAERP